METCYQKIIQRLNTVSAEWFSGVGFTKLQSPKKKSEKGSRFCPSNMFTLSIIENFPVVVH